MPKESGHAILTVPESVRTATGGATTADAAGRCDVLVPSSSDLFHISPAQAVIVTNSDGEPGAGARAHHLGRREAGDARQALHAWVLPKPKEAHRCRDRADTSERWDSPAQVDADVLAKSTPVALTLVPSEQEYATLHSFKLKVPENA